MMAENKTQVIDIQGVKVEADLQSVKGVKSYKVGDPIKVRKHIYSDHYETYPGVIINVTNCDTLPTLEILYVRTDYSGTNIEFLTFNSKTTGVEIIPVSEYEALFDRLDILDKLDRTITFKEEELRILKAKKKAFLSHFPSLEG